MLQIKIIKILGFFPVAENKLNINKLFTAVILSPMEWGVKTAENGGSTEVSRIKAGFIGLDVDIGNSLNPVNGGLIGFSITLGIVVIEFENKGDILSEVMLEFGGSFVVRR